MSKVLISFLGTGRPTKNGNEREYRTAKYRFDDGKEIETSLVADAIKKHDNIEKLILIGTVKSMWEEVYKKFCNEENLDPDYYVTLGDRCEKARHDTPLEIPNKEKVEAVLGNEGKIILIKYGLNSQEVNENALSIMGIEDMLSDGDEITMDITHAFRSLPLMLMNALIYMETISSKNIKIKNIKYGMLDISSELGYTPVVNLNSVIDFSNMISGAYSLMEFSNAYKLSGLLKNKGYDSAANILKDFSEANNLNNVSVIRSNRAKLLALNGDDELPQMERKVIKPMVEEYTSIFKTEDKDYLFLYKLAKWHNEKHRYAASYLALTDSIKNYVCYKENISQDNDEERKKVMDTMKARYEDLYKIYGNVRRSRNSIAHIRVGENSIKTQSMISSLNANIKLLGTFYEKESEPKNGISETEEIAEVTINLNRGTKIRKCKLEECGKEFDVVINERKETEFRDVKEGEKIVVNVTRNSGKIIKTEYLKRY